ncbi:hypothetical protein DOJK_00150 [Patescibacteria group bacterium]|nr:hypothetical protein DOJK_00150 [Patescibacteria group bacterium]
MKKTEIKDSQFGQLNYEDGWGWCAKNVEGLSNITDLCIQMELTENNGISEQARKIFNTLCEREHEFKVLAARELLDSVNNIINDIDEENEELEVLDIEDFVNLLSLCWVYIDENGDSELQYITGDFPLVRIFISQDLNFKEAFLD